MTRTTPSPSSYPLARFSTITLNTIKTEQLPVTEGMSALLTKWGLASQTQECFWVIAYDAMMQVRDVIEVARGSYSKVAIHFPAVLSAVLITGSDRFQIAHNHPAGRVTPTQKDIDLTLGLMEGANACGLYLEDHIIVGPDGTSFSFRAKGLLIPATYNGDTQTKTNNKLRQASSERR